MEKVFTSYPRVPSGASSPTMVAMNPPSHRRLKTAVILAAVVMMAALVMLLGARNREYIEQNLPDTLSLGKILPPASTSSSTSSSLELSPKTVAQVQNSSLGFEKVFLINLPMRTDKLDAQTLAASLTGFNFTVSPGVQNDEVAPVTLPWAFGKDTPNVHGCWRAHLNALRQIVYEGLETALIIEDDSDWDVHLMTILPSIAAGTQKLLHTDEKFETPHSPYGDGWDLLWLGHCASELRTDAERFLIHNDPTVRPPSKAWEMWKSGYNAKGVNNSTRVVSKANNAICTNGYAVSFAGARKILYHASIEPNPDAIDTRFNSLCDSKHSKKYPHFECLHVYPAIFNSYRKAGRADGDSDQTAGKKNKDKNDDGNNKTEKKIKMRDHAMAWNNVWSMMLNLGNLVNGKEPEVQWKLDGWERERELDETKGVMFEWQEAGWWQGMEKEKEKVNGTEGKEAKTSSA